MALLAPVLWLVEAGLALISLYVVALTAAAFLPRRNRYVESKPAKRFAILIPAHDEELLLDRTIDSLAHLDYPAGLFDVYVVADNCSDGTASVARARRVTVFERDDRDRVGKGYALRWLLDRVASLEKPHDALVIIDADSVVSPNFLAVMNHKLLTGSRVIQAYYTVANPSESWSTGLRYVALALLHYLRPLGKGFFGGSAGLKGNGMCFARSVVAQHGWNAFGLAEDVEYHLRLVSSGIKVDFAPEGVVRAEMPGSLRGARSQNLRWERGRLDVARRFVPRLLLSGLSTRNLAQLDAALEQLVPPFSVPAALSVTCLFGGIALGSQPIAVVALVLILCQLVYVLGGLALVRAPLPVCLALLRAPLYVAWKVGLCFVAALNMGDRQWVRTTRA